MASQSVSLLVCAILVAVGVASALPPIHETSFYSRFETGPGDVSETWQQIEWPEGHIGVLGFESEVVDEEGKSVPLTDVYLHHWLAIPMNVKKGFKQLTSSVPKSLDMTEEVWKRIPLQDEAEVKPKAVKAGTAAGTCSDDTIANTIGAGSETRKSNFRLPEPYAHIYGDPAQTPEGYEQAFYLNVHAIDTRGAVSKKSCYECLCDAYGVTEYQGKPLPKGYRGGFFCCYDKTHCAVKDDFVGEKKTYALKFTITWVKWDPSVIPVRQFGIDITDSRTSVMQKPNCQIEFTVPECNPESATNGCVDRRRTVGASPVSGDLIFSRMHQHSGSMGGVIYYKNNSPLCVSEPIYGQGTEAGDEAGYVVGVTSCTYEPGSMKVEAMKEITMEAMYSNEQEHTGAMSIFGLYVADPVDYIQEVTDGSL